VLQFLEGVALSPAMVAAATRRAAARRSDPDHDHDHARPPPAQGIPLINGRALAVAYLEWLVSHGPHGPAGAKSSSSSSSSGASGGGGGAPPGLHDEYAQLLMEGIPFDVDGDAINRASRGGPAGEGEGVWEARPEVRPSPYSSLRYNIFPLKCSPSSRPCIANAPFPPRAPRCTQDSDALRVYKIYRRKLQTHLATSREYHAERLLKVPLPSPYLRPCLGPCLGPYRRLHSPYLIHAERLL